MNETKGLNKVDRYNWKLMDEPGELVNIYKGDLVTDESYQRDASSARILSIAREWSWIACGAIIVGKRNGIYFVIDGQHRVKAAMERRDITVLPCIVFKTETNQEEAKGFLRNNTTGKPMAGAEKHKASVITGDENALFIDYIFRKNNLIPAISTGTRNSIKDMAWVTKKSKENRGAFEAAVQLAAEISNGTQIKGILLDGLYFIHIYVRPLTDRRLRQRIKQLGSETLILGAKRAAAFYVKGGNKIWAEGMMNEINKGLRDKIEKER